MPGSFQMTASPSTQDASPCDWNLPADRLPAETDVLVIGAGPAGCACARWLAQAGVPVVQIDSHRFPREKVCGDGLVPDTLAALDRLGLKSRVLQQARVVPHARCVAPSGRLVDVPGELAVLPREQLDALLCTAAVEAGTRMFAPLRFTALLLDDQQRVMGARVSATGPDGAEVQREIRARWTILATGAAAGPLATAGVCERRTPSAMAVRTFVRHPALASELEALRFVWHPRLKGGYGWIFPGPDGVLNIGAGILDSHTRFHDAAGMHHKPVNLRKLFDEFVALDPVAGRLMREGKALGPLKGAPLRCDLEGAAWSRPGLLVAGEAAGTTYAFTGEGIGKAMESGIAAAESILAGLRGDDASVLAHYQQGMAALLPRFQLYRKAASFNRWPWLIELMIWRAQGNRRLIGRLADILNERRMPGSLLSWRGLKTLLRG